MKLHSIARRLDRLDALTAEDSGRTHYIWREIGETAEQAIERASLQGHRVAVIGWLDSE
jgi:hypothetical protein